MTRWAGPSHNDSPGDDNRDDDRPGGPEQRTGSDRSAGTAQHPSDSDRPGSPEQRARPRQRPGDDGHGIAEQHTGGKRWAGPTQQPSDDNRPDSPEQRARPAQRPGDDGQGITEQHSGGERWAGPTQQPGDDNRLGTTEQHTGGKGSTEPAQHPSKGDRSDASGQHLSDGGRWAGPSHSPGDGGRTAANRGQAVDGERPPSPAEDAALRSLRAAAGRRDPVPEYVLAAARASLSWRDPDAALAQLTADSANARLVAVRGGGSPRLLSFFGGSVTIDVQATARDGTIELLGEVTPVVAARVVLESPAGTQETDVDDDGGFRFLGVPAGSFRLRCEPVGGAPVHTEWVLL